MEILSKKSLYFGILLSGKPEKRKQYNTLKIILNPV
jgi:hypothetical protein